MGEVMWTSGHAMPRPESKTRGRGGGGGCTLSAAALVPRGMRALTKEGSPGRASFCHRNRAANRSCLRTHDSLRVCHHARYLHGGRGRASEESRLTCSSSRKTRHDGTHNSARVCGQTGHWNRPVEICMPHSWCLGIPTGRLNRLHLALAATQPRHRENVRHRDRHRGSPLICGQIFCDVAANLCWVRSLQEPWRALFCCPAAVAAVAAAVAGARCGRRRQRLVSASRGDGAGGRLACGTRLPLAVACGATPLARHRCAAAGDGSKA